MTADVVRVGGRGPLGLTSLGVVTAARAGKLEVRPSAWRNAKGLAAGVSSCRFLPEALGGVDRLFALARPALEEALAGVREPVPLALGLAGPERPDAPREPGELLRRLARGGDHALPVDEARSTLHATGHASFGAALEAAAALVERGAPLALAGAVDSVVGPDALAWLDAGYRLHGEGVEDGVIPGEGAAFVLLAGPLRGGATPFEGPAPPRVASVHFARTALEPGGGEPEGPVLAQAVTSLVHEAMAIAAPRWILNDVDEYHRVREWSRVELRVAPAFEGVPELRVPDRFGDVGAATGALAALLVARSWSIGAPPRGPALVALHSDGAERSVFLLSEASP